MAARESGVLGSAVGALRDWLRGRRGAAARPEAASRGPGARESAPVVTGAAAAADAELRAALAQASGALWRHALGAPPGTNAAPGALDALRAAVRPVLEGELADRHFPRRPMLMPQLMAALHDPTSAATRLAQIISQDPVLAGNVLRLANSAWYRVTRDPVETLQRAVIVCGTDGLQSLAALALMQPVFRGESGPFGRLPALLWERTARATLAAELYAQQVCPAERQSAQLLVLLRALGPLVVFRAAEEQYRANPRLGRDPAACAALLAEAGGRTASRIAVQWDSSERIRDVLAELDAPRPGRIPDEVQRDLAAAVGVGELLGTASVLIAEQAWEPGAGMRLIEAAGMPRDWMLATMTRLGRQE